MSEGVTDQEQQIIQMMILDRWNPGRINEKIANHFGLTKNQVRHIRRKPQFNAEYARQLAIYKSEISNIRLGDRKERVRAMSDLYEKIPDCRVALKLKVLAQIRAETAGNEFVSVVGPQQERKSVESASYEKWLEKYRVASSSD